MREKTTPIRTMKPVAKPCEEGYILVAVMFMLVLLMIALAVAAPKVAKAIQRDHEVETMHRGKQYARAVKLYYKKFGAYPPNVDALVKTNEIRFLRKKYTDPITGKDDWKTIAIGQNKVPTAWGFFGVPLNGAGAGSLCGNALPSSTGSSGPTTGGSFGGNGGGFSSGSSFGSPGGSSGSGFGSSPTTSGPTAGCPTDSSGSGSSTPGTATGVVGGTDPNAANGSTDPNAAGGGAGTQTGTSGSSSGTSSGTGTGTNGGTSLDGQTFGGAGIIGFTPGSNKQSILTYHKKNHYNEWEFVYDPLAEQMMMQGGAGGAGLNPAGTGSGTNGGSSGFGGTNGISGGGGINPGQPNPTGGGTPGGIGPGSSPQ